MQNCLEIFEAKHTRIVTDELKSKIYKIAKDVVKLEDKFIDFAYNDHEIEGPKKKMSNNISDILQTEDYYNFFTKPNFNAKDNPLPWLDWVLNGASHDNFFEKRVTEYSVNGANGDWGSKKLIHHKH